MKDTGFCILFMMIAFLGNTQKMPSDYFEEAEAFFDARLYKKAIAGYLYIVNHHPRNSFYQNALNNLAYAYWSSGDTTKAISLFQTILSGNFNDKRPVITDIMASPFTNYKHYASMSLYEINNDRKQYDSALYYLNLANTGSPYEHFCGNAQDSKSIYMALRYAELFEQLKDTVNTEKALLDAIFLESEGNGEVLDRLQDIYKKSGLKNLDIEFDLAVDSLQYTFRSPQSEYKEYLLRFRNVGLVIPEALFMFTKDVSISNVRERLRKSMFRDMLVSLYQ